MVQNVRMCIDINHIHKIIPLVELNTVPDSPKYLVGIMNVNGNSIHVIDMALRAGIERYETYSTETPILLCQDKEKTIGLIIDKIIGIADITDESIQMKPEFKKQNSLFLGSIVDDIEPSLLVNIAYLFSNDRDLGRQNI